MKRKLAAILSADVAGYSRLIEHDDEHTVRTLSSYRSYFQAEIERSAGRLVDAPGDNLLAEFDSAVEAVRCAIAVQSGLHTRNLALTADRRMLFRIGINAGDILVEDGRLYGDAVNIAARLEALADPGGVCVSAAVVEQVRSRVDAHFEFAGEQQVKNISASVAVWHISMPQDGVPATTPRSWKGPNRRAWLAAAGVVTLLLLLLVVARPTSTSLPKIPAKSETPAALRQTPDRVPVRPAIVVLPFSNLSDDSTQSYFSDGITEDLITDLSKLDSIYVVDANAAFRFRGREVAATTLRDEFGVRYLVEGSVRKAGDLVRITVRLIDAEGDITLWSERYDVSFENILELQDDIRTKILTALKVKLTPAEQARFEYARTTSLEAYDYYLRGDDLIRRSRTELRRELMGQAIKNYDRAIELDPRFAVAYGRKGMALWLTGIYHWAEDSAAVFHEANTMFEQTLALDPHNFEASRFLIFTLWQESRLDEALEMSARWVAARPDNATAQRMHAYTMAYRGEYQHALEGMKRSAASIPTGRLDDHDLWFPGMLHLLLGDVASAFRCSSRQRFEHRITCPTTSC